MDAMDATPLNERLYEANGHRVDVCRFCASLHLPDEIQALVGDMQPGHELLIEDGASILHTLRRVA